MTNAPNPYQTAIMPKEVNYKLDTRNQEMMNAEEEKNHDAPRILIYPLDQLTQLLSSTYTSLVQVYSVLDQAKQNPVINSKALTKLQNKIDKINRLILDLPEELDNLGIQGKI